VTKSAALQERVAEAILDVAADLLARGGEPPSMAEIAAAAGVSRATLYRYYPTRERLLQALTAAGLASAAAKLAEAGLDTVPVPEAIARLARVVASAGSKYAAVVSAFDPDGAVERQIGTMIETLLQRGLDDGTFRGDLTVEELGFVLGQLLQAAGRMAAEHQAGVEKAAALITTVFLHGTANRDAADHAKQDSGLPPL
jgi:TetR/AcrR family transcriptional regulator, mexCD-oprJ operon repressor